MGVSKGEKRLFGGLIMKPHIPTFLGFPPKMLYSLVPFISSLHVVSAFHFMIHFPTSF